MNLDQTQDFFKVFKTIDDKDLPALRRRIENGWDSKTRDPAGGRTALMRAAHAGWAEGVEFLIPLSDPLAVDAAGHSALYYGAEKGTAAVADLLIPVSDVGRADPNGATAAQNAVARMRKEYARRLLPLSDMSQRTANGMTLLMWAAQSGDAQMTRLVLDQFDEAGARAAARETTNNGRTALMGAAANGNEATARLLLPMSDLGQADPNGNTPLILAAQSGRPDCARFLLGALPPEALEASNGAGTAVDAALSRGHEALADEMALKARRQEQKALLERWGAIVDLPKTRAAFEQAELAALLAEQKTLAADESDPAASRPALRL